MSQPEQTTPDVEVIDDEEHLRRPFILGAGEPPLMPALITDIPGRFVAFCQSTGLSAKDVVTSSMCAMPMPRYHGGDNPRQWGAELNPQLLWHPLLWLPASVTAVRTITDAVSGRDREESADEHCARLALELMASNLYEAETGTWVDVLSLYGIDSQSDETIERLAGWLAGAPDTVLDSIDISELLDMPGHREWASDLVAAMSPALMLSRFALLSSDVLEILDEFANPDAFDDTALPVVTEAVSTVLSIAAFELSEIPAERIAELPEVSVRTPDEVRETLSAAGREVAEWNAGGIGELMDVVVTPAAELISAIKDQFTPDYMQVDAWLTGRDEIPGLSGGSELAVAAGADV